MNDTPKNPQTPTDLAEQAQRPSLHLVTQTPGSQLTEAQQRLVPASRREFATELTACLALVAPSGMTADDRKEWLRVAHMTLSAIPGDLLARGCEHARRTCRFASEIVPAIIKETETQMRWRSENLRNSTPSLRLASPKIDPEYVDPAEVRALLKSLGSH